MKRRPARALGLATTLAGAVWAVVAWRLSGNRVEYPRFVDDAFYYFQIAANIAAGDGVSMDRLDPSSGFHPLWMAICAVAFWVAPSLAVGLVVIQAIVIGLVGLVVGLVVRLLLSLVGVRITIVAVSVVLFATFLASMNSGLETPLVMALLFGLVLVLVEHPAWATEASSSHRLVIGGLLAALVGARVDNGFVVAVVCLVALGRAWGEGPRSFGSLVRRVAPVAGPPALATVLWGAALVAIDGEPVPVSGQLKTAFPEPGWRIDMALNPPFLALLVVAIVGWLVARRPTARPAAQALGPVLGMLTAASAALFVFVALFWTFAPQNWDFMLMLPAGLLGLVVLLDAAREPAPRLATVAVVVAVAVSTSAFAVSSWRYWGSSPITAAEEAGTWARTELPADTVMAMEDSGAFTFWAERRVINLDGLAGSRAFSRAVCRGELHQFLAEREVEYVAQDLVPDAVAAGDYEIHAIPVVCRLEDGQSDQIVVRREDQVFQSQPYRVFREGLGGAQTPSTSRLTVWRWTPPTGG